MISLGIVASTIGALNYLDKTDLVFSTNIMNLIIIVPFVTFSLLLTARNRIVGSFGKAWICFAVFAVSWSVGEIIWALDELVYKQDPFPSEANFFWFLGYPAYFIFALMYIKPFKNSISAKAIALTVIVSASLMAFLIYYAITDSSLSEFETMLLVSYPVADAICLAPTIIGFVLFFRGQVNSTWLLLLMGMFCFIVADSGFQIISQNEQYYTGHPIDILYLWAYVFFVFGIYHHLQMFRIRNQENRFNNQDNLK